jgi:phosphatidylglycerophosphate synthase
LQFVVQTLLASNPLRRINGGDPEDGIAAFGTPTVVHFTLALLISAVLCAPWGQYGGGLRATLGVFAACSLVYSVIVMQRARHQRNYVPEAEDWIWHILLPIVAYGGILLAVLLLSRTAALPLLMIAAATLLLLCIGIHNAWDTVTYLTLNALRTELPEQKPTPPQHNVHSKRQRHRR